MTVLKDAKKTLSWSAYLNVGSRLISFLTVLIAARVLEPSTFGLYAIIFSINAIVNLFGVPGSGLFAAIINSKRYQSIEYLQTAWTIETFTVNIVVFLLVIVSAFVAPNFYHNAGLKGYLLFLSLIPLVRSFQSFYNVELLIGLDFKALFKFKILPLLVKSLSGVLLILLMKNIWALLLPELIGVVILVIMSHILTESTIKISYNYTRIRSLWSFSKYIMLTRVIVILKTGMDKLILGKLFSLSELGFYQIGEKVSNLLTNTYTSIFNKALYPVYSKSKNENQNITILPQIIIETINFFLIPLLLIVSIYSHEVITIIFGAKWLASSPVFIVFLYIAIFRLFNNTLGLFYRGYGLPKVEFQMNLLFVVVYSVAIIFLAKYGILFGALAVLISEVAASVYLMVSGRFLNINIRNKVYYIFIVAIISSFLLYVLGSIIPSFKLYIVLSIIGFVAVFFKLYHKEYDSFILLMKVFQKIKR